MFKIESNKMKKLKQLPDKKIKLKPLREICEQYINEIESGDFLDSDLPHFIYEIAMVTIYGKDIFKYINKKSN